MATTVGVDGCKAGWFYFRRDGTSLAYGVASDFPSLIKALPAGSRVFIDIPIGLPDHGPYGRECDILARKYLGRPRGSSVFPAPAYAVLSAGSYAEAKQLSVDATGKMLSQQAFAIVPKIREVNVYLASNLHSEVAVREVHPEVCFWALNGRQPMRHPKKTTPGYAERLNLLRKVIADVESVIQAPLQAYRRKDVARDDIVDALVALVVGCAADEQLRTFPASPGRDARGLPMEMVFTELRPSALQSIGPLDHLQVLPDAVGRSHAHSGEIRT